MKMRHDWTATAATKRRRAIVGTVLAVAIAGTSLAATATSTARPFRHETDGARTSGALR